MPWLPDFLLELPEMSGGFIDVNDFSVGFNQFHQLLNDQQSLLCQSKLILGCVEGLMGLQISHIVLSVELTQDEP